MFTVSAFQALIHGLINPGRAECGYGFGEGGSRVGKQGQGTEECYCKVKVADPSPVALDSRSVTMNSTLYSPTRSLIVLL